ncbi:DUF4064 domain-containing protein [Peribacillus sp. NJ4]|uniref:DUF4064 domain-containing protein n=1 Tax=Peribacillus TaxID=2675229 RepID=UPI0025A2420F|nr:MULTISPECIES: DUF4064 domain-containing protein [unclassified Peribacillus]MDM5211265.1 DUF4064 domain-containing protein [Peribacillus sp. NJ4]MDM5221576.1 DUF4064 domain-containing protein [Peribacillus sp. NJ11]
MKRTWEFVLSIIGVSIAAISLIVTIITAVYLNSIDMTEMMDYSLMSDSEFSTSEVDMSIKFFMGLLWAGIISLFIALAGGLIAIFLLKGGKAKAAGILLIITGILTIFHVWPLIFFIVPGIMCLARKPRETVEVIV